MQSFSPYGSIDQELYPYVLRQSLINIANQQLLSVNPHKGVNIMAFTDFKSADEVQKLYRIKYMEEEFLQIPSISAPESLVQDYEFNNHNFDIFASEASRCENVIYPILREVCKKFVKNYSLLRYPL